MQAGTTTGREPDTTATASSEHTTARELLRRAGAFENDTDEVEALDTETLLDLLQNDRRREAINYLATEAVERDVSLGELADHVAATTEEDAKGTEGEIRKRVYVSLVQNHLPKLKDSGAVEEVAEKTYRFHPERARRLLSMKRRVEAESVRGLVVVIGDSLALIGRKVVGKLRAKFRSVF